MSEFTVTSRCECQATLSAILDGKRQVISAGAGLHGATERAPAHAIGTSAERFDVAWMCPFCGRNTLRSFFTGALRRLPKVEGEAGAPTGAAS
jgi:hypothetical protein